MLREAKEEVRESRSAEEGVEWQGKLWEEVWAEEVVQR